MDGLGSASPPVAPTATTGEGRHPCTWPRTFWFKPLSAFGLLDLTTFISSSPELAMPSTLAPNRLSASSRRALSREARPPWVGEVTLSQELRTARSPRPHVLVGYQWSHTGLRPGRKTSHNRYIRSFVSHPPQIRACTSRAPGSSSHEFATRAIRRRYVDMVQVTMYLPGFSSTAHETAPPSLDLSITHIFSGALPLVNLGQFCDLANPHQDSFGNGAHDLTQYCLGPSSGFGG